MIKNQRGFALIQVMLVFAILIIVAAKMQYEQRLQIERTRQMLFISQAQAYTESAEGVATVGLYLDAEYTDNDNFYEAWSTTTSVYPPADGWLLGAELNDLQGRFNLNWLSTDGSNRANAAKGFKRLLTLLEQDEDIADELLNWFDSESSIDQDYNDQQPPYAPSYHLMADVSELLLLKSVSYDAYSELAPYLSALPAGSALNVNTAPVAVIQSIASYIDDSSAEELVANREEEGYDSTSDFLDHEIFESNEDEDRYISSLSVNSEWFELYTEVSFENRVHRTTSLLYRNGSDVTLYGRNRSVSEANHIPGDPVKIDTSTDAQSDEELEQ
ncbi:type II secretion system minor pseudopilin GspK [Reinekea marinisedimentorum]|uniref:Type II secretion system protein K n=1 Tax=Reinekea marinisedimentorum TaxID=230495 RepID=A0A4R3IAJ5_9GAMM|nr:type II secretion system minor pseudopilin GspK [Reinekea marinisedimentorum]TCS42537.1 general secretion pathway protein K [Reinekea marinisedimentorum]